MGWREEEGVRGESAMEAERRLSSSLAVEAWCWEGKKKFDLKDAQCSETDARNQWL